MASREKELLDAAMRVYCSLEEHEVAGDGNCMFRAVAVQTPAGEDSFTALRTAAVQDVEENLHEYLEFFAG